MIKRILVLAVGASLAFGVATAYGVASHVILDLSDTASGYSLHGKVHSNRDACEANRRVKIFFMGKSVTPDPSSDDVLGSDTTSPIGRYRVSFHGTADAGNYYSKVASKELSSGVFCGSDISNVVGNGG